MCLTCGCMEPDNDHGNPGHLLAAHLKGSAAIDGISAKKAIKVMRKTLKVDHKARPDDYKAPSHADVPPPPAE